MSNTQISSKPDNKRIVLIAGGPSMGKTHSLHQMANDPGVAYLNTDLKDLPFRIPTDGTGMKHCNVDDAMIAPDAVAKLEADMPEIHTVVVDTITFLMNQYRNQYVLNAPDTRAAWQQYAMYYHNLMHQIKSGTKNYIILAHTTTAYNETELVNETTVPIQGSVGKVGVEADYNIIITPRKITLTALQPYLDGNDLLTVTDREQKLGFKYVFQTGLTAETLGEKIRSPMDLWAENELYINNDIQLITNRLAEYYNS